MKTNARKIALFMVFTILLVIAVVYFSFLCLLPFVCNSKWFSTKVSALMLRRTGVHSDIHNLKLSTYPDMSSDLHIEHVNLSDKNKNSFIIGEDIILKFESFKIRPNSVSIGYLFFDKPVFEGIHFSFKENKNKTFSVEKLPYINVRKSDIVLQDNQKDRINLLIGKFNIVPYNDKFIIDTDAKLYSRKMNKSIKLGSRGYLSLKNNTVRAENFGVRIGKVEVRLSGKLADNKKNFDFDVKAKGVSVKLIKVAFLATMKHFKPNEKNFIENFYDFGGFADFDLKVNNKGIFGDIHTTNLSAKTVKFSIPVLFPDVRFKFNGDNMYASSVGLFGHEKVYSDVKAVSMFDKSRMVVGHVQSEVGSKFAQKYVPYADVTNRINLSIKYVVHNQKPLVEYWAKIPIGANVYYRGCDLGLLGDRRRVYGRTLKDGDNMFLQTFDYSVVKKDDKIDAIISGNGLLKRENNKFHLEYITGKTDGDAPVSLTGSFGRHVKGGTFNGNITYYYPKEIVTGNFSLKNSYYKDFYIKSAKVSADEKIMEIEADGTYNKAIYTGFINLDNHFKNRITIHNLDLYLEKFTLEQNKRKKNVFHVKLPEKTKKIDWIVEHGTIKLDKITYGRVVMENLYLVGSLKKDNVIFDMPDIKFANGTLSAKGTFYIPTKSSDIDFSAHNIDSNRAADMLLNLQNQVMGYANVNTHLITKNKLDKIYAHTEFNIQDGALTKLGNREFIINKSKKHQIKFSLPDVIHINKEKLNIIKADLHGTFDVRNEKIEYINVYSHHRFLATFLEGEYNMDTQAAEFYLWGKYNKNAQKGIKVLFLPLSVVTKIVLRPEKTKDLYMDKINKIPEIEANKNQLEIFKVKVQGNPNKASKLKYELKRLY